MSKSNEPIITEKAKSKNYVSNIDFSLLPTKSIEQQKTKNNIVQRDIEMSEPTESQNANPLVEHHHGDLHIHENHLVKEGITKFIEGEDLHTVATCITCHEVRPIFFSHVPKKKMMSLGRLGIKDVLGATMNSTKKLKAILIKHSFFLELFPKLQIVSMTKVLIYTITKIFFLYHHF